KKRGQRPAGSEPERFLDGDPAGADYLRRWPERFPGRQKPALMLARALPLWAGLVLYWAPGNYPTPGLRLFLGQIPTGQPKTQVIDLADRFPHNAVDQDLWKKPFMSLTF